MRLLTAVVIAVARSEASVSRAVSSSWRAVLTEALSLRVEPVKVPRSVPREATLENRFSILIAFDS